MLIKKCSERGKIANLSGKKAEEKETSARKKLAAIAQNGEFLGGKKSD